MSSKLIHSLTRAELRDACGELGQPAYRADQIWRWLYVNRVRDWAAMRNLPAALRDEIARRFSLNAAVAAAVQGDSRETHKILVELRDGEKIEEVLIPAAARRTVCVSSQVGCRYGCAFCASGKSGFTRNLETGEIVGQVLLAGDVFGDRPTHVVFMGIGEPFDNYEAVLAAVRIINDDGGIGIGARRITISTCGLVPGIQRLAKEGLQVELSVSLHAPTSELRQSLMPVNSRYPLDDLLAACRAYSETTGRIVTFEYTLIGGVNDSREQAERLCNILKPLSCRVNLIPLSGVEEFSGTPSSRAAATMFMETLGRKGINATLRDSQGQGLKAACGQLRARS